MSNNVVLPKLTFFSKSKSTEFRKLFIQTAAFSMRNTIIVNCTALPTSWHTQSDPNPTTFQASSPHSLGCLLCELEWAKNYCKQLLQQIQSIISDRTTLDCLQAFHTYMYLQMWLTLDNQMLDQRYQLSHWTSDSFLTQLIQNNRSRLPWAKRKFSRYFLINHQILGDRMTNIHFLNRKSTEMDQNRAPSNAYKKPNHYPTPKFPSSNRKSPIA